MYVDLEVKISAQRHEYLNDICLTEEGGWVGEPLGLGVAWGCGR